MAVEGPCLMVKHKTSIAQLLNYCDKELHTLSDTHEGPFIRAAHFGWLNFFYSQVPVPGVRRSLKFTRSLRSDGRIRFIWK